MESRHNRFALSRTFALTISFRCFALKKLESILALARFGAVILSEAEGPHSTTPTKATSKLAWTSRACSCAKKTPSARMAWQNIVFVPSRLTIFQHICCCPWTLDQNMMWSISMPVHRLGRQGAGSEIISTSTILFVRIRALVIARPLRHTSTSRHSQRHDSRGQSTFVIRETVLIN
jgi:hypothetical protein